jgi:GGDEF domain-containing protein
MTEQNIIRLSGVHGKGVVVLVDSDDFKRLNRHPWHLTSRGYAARTVYRNGKNTLLLMHRDIKAAQKGQELDHINRNRLDNRKENLRFCDHKTNLLNRNYNFGSVNWHTQRQKFHARIQINLKRVSLGLFNTRQEAELALATYKKAL